VQAVTIQPEWLLRTAEATLKSGRTYRINVELERPERGREPSCWKSLSILILPSLQVVPERNIDGLETSTRIRSNTAMDKFVPRHPYVVH
jgi:hypothetical protein